MPNWKHITIAVISLCSCNGGEKTKPVNQKSNSNTGVVHTASPLKKSILGLYVQHYFSGNSHAYNIGYENGHYTGEYTEIQEGNESVTKLEDLLVDTTTGTVILKMNGVVSKAQITPDGLILESDDFPFAKME